MYHPSYMARRFAPDKTRKLLETRGISVRSVATRMDPGNVEQERNTLKKWLKGQHAPRQASVERLAAAIPAEVEEITEEEPEDPADAVIRKATAVAERVLAA